MRMVRRICFPFILFVVILYNGFLLWMKTTKLTGSDHRPPVVTQNYAWGKVTISVKNTKICILYTFLPLNSALWHFVKTVEIIIISSVAGKKISCITSYYLFIKSSLFFSIYSAKFFFELFLQIVLLIVV